MTSLPRIFTQEMPSGRSFRMILVEGGTFWMGADPNDDHARDREKPRHLVKLSPFYLAEFQVTQGLYEEVMGNNPSRFEGKNHPVERVSWHDAQGFIKALEDLTVMTFCLPTEAQWEYAARGGKYNEGYRYAGSDKLVEVGWYGKNIKRSTQEVGQLLPNELGFYDLSGNVWEWCQDNYDKNYYQVLKDHHSKKPAADPEGPKSGSTRVVRGGSWYPNSAKARVAFRGYSHPNGRSNSVGFRLCRYPSG